MFFRNLIASGCSAKPPECFCRLFVSKICFFSLLPCFVGLTPRLGSSRWSFFVLKVSGRFRRGFGVVSGRFRGGSFFRNLIASGYSAKPPECFCRLFVPKICLFFLLLPCFAGLTPRTRSSRWSFFFLKVSGNGNLMET